MSIDWPRNDRAERLVLGALMSDSGVLTDLGLAASDFHRPTHAALFGLMGEMTTAGEMPDPDGILARVGSDERFGGPGLVAALYADAPSPGRLEHFAMRIREASVLRAKLRATLGMQDAITRGNTNGDLSSAEDAMRAALEATTGAAIVSRADRHARMLEGFGKGGRFIPTPIRDLDALLGGLPLGEHTILGGRSGERKTALALYLAVHAAMEGVGVLILSLEQAEQEIVKRLLAQLAYLSDWRHEGVSYGRLRWETADVGDVEGLSSRLADLPLWIVDDVHESERLHQTALSYISRRGVQLVILDHAQRVQDSTVRGDSSERLALRNLSRWFYALSKRRGVAGLLISQLNRRSEMGEKRRRPRPSDLKGAGSLEEDADNILLMHSDPDQPTGEILIAKNRSGAAAGHRIQYVGNADFLAFEALSNREEP